ncbi:MAG: DNA polymerase III subunit epsilon [Gammaproteobacteria bacterium RIFCSPHIGHO2_02_FULL_42_13]|nr:MAG: DNA polymerase III subunit epsilon [Gammaproteobacteria bacterium RIFCSPHIGHO2_02_FULL_42_13]OGT68934.1 MAG: DNA polymerase III subunit epsilon [Gammaproteobacteria bacterium RIFCSPLOWO2_02_FULL_42_9]
MRQVSLDVETTGLNTSDGHRIIEIGCVEIVDRRVTRNNFHYYLNPERESDPGALAVHGLTNEFLRDKPKFSTVAESLCEFVKDAEVVIHNAPFDVGFIDYELKLMRSALGKLNNHCEIFDTLMLARKLHPGQRNSLDALCKRYGVDATNRTLHGALLDAELLAFVYLAMTGGQSVLFAEAQSHSSRRRTTTFRREEEQHPALSVVRATKEEQDAHDAFLEMLNK